MSNKKLDHNLDNYLDKIGRIAERNFEDLVAEKGEDEANRIAGIGLWYDDPLEDGDSWSDIGLEQRAAAHRVEAYALIDALAGSPQSAEYYDLTLTRRYLRDSLEAPRIDNKIIHVKMTRAEIIERLEWIASFKFGDNVEEWQKWAETRKREGFFVGR